MLRSPDEEDIPLPHRPLPSVDIALLPHELRAIRMQRWAIGGAGAALVLIAVGLSYGKSVWARLHASRDPGTWSQSERSAASDPTLTSGAGSQPPLPVLAGPAASKRRAASTHEHRAAPAEADGVSNHGALGRVEHRFGRARSFREALLLGGASPNEASQLIEALEKLVDFRRGKPEDVMIFERDPDKQLRAFEYRASITEVYRAVRNEAGALRGLRLDIPIERRRVATGTYISGTLGHSLSALGLGRSLAGLVTEAFGSRIAFTRDTRTGDSVKLIVDEEYVDGAFLRYGNVQAVEYASERAGKLQVFWYEPEREPGDYYDGAGRALHGGWLRTPLRYDHISSPFNLKRRHPILKRVMPHLGIDYSATTGTPVWAAAEGTITFAGPRGPNGNLVSLRHKNGFESHYAHLWKISAGIKSGSRVSQRQVVGFVGSTGRSTGPHLHFALKRGGRFVDPVTQLNGLGEPLPPPQQARFRALAQRLREELEHIALAPAPGADPDSLKPDEPADDEDLDL
jgi:murein DD-endopeptidase MepM/ murein hydrolase activator NlpD